jgi:hypothetical protein
MGSRSEVPFLPLVSAVYAVYFALPVFLAPSFRLSIYGNFVADPAVEKALFWAFLGLLLLYFGYYGTIGKSIARHIPTIGLRWNQRSNLQPTIVALGSLGLAVYYLTFIIVFPVEAQQIVDLLWSLADIAVAVLFALGLRRRLSRISKMVLWCVLLPGRLAIGLASGFSAQGLELVLLLLIVYTCVRRRFPIKAAVLGILLLPFLFASRNELRARTWSGFLDSGSYGADQLSPIQRVITYGDAIVYALGSGGTSIHESIDFTVYRMSQLFLFADVIELTPTVIPYWNGQTYYPLFTKFIPRMLWPAKPREDVGQTFGHRYGLIEPGDTLTSVNLPQLVEFYVNFGPAGVVAGMFLLGIFYRAVQKLIGAGVSDVGIVACGSFTFMRLSLIESSLSLVIGGLIWLICLFILLDYTLKMSDPAARRLEKVHA